MSTRPSGRFVCCSVPVSADENGELGSATDLLPGAAPSRGGPADLRRAGVSRPAARRDGRSRALRPAGAARSPRLRPDARDRQDVEAIVARLEGLPLAVELAAARIRLFPPSRILERLESSLDLLSAGARDLPERQRTIRGAIAWSVDLLDEEERALFRRTRCVQWRLDGRRRTGGRRPRCSRYRRLRRARIAGRQEPCPRRADRPRRTSVHPPPVRPRVRAGAPGGGR